ncbi:membrane protein [Aliivibrio wodanis]|uniref:Membrane protein n=1 Tax=Aliivibrio wodanis TaxID=80852 RepID=A0A090IAD5_9GAMM|nr:membrane protein [Aliivibrio wodanis]
MKVGWFIFFFVVFWCSFIRFGIELLLPQIQAFQKLIYASIVLWLCLILACISVFLSAFSIPIVVWIFGLSVPNWLKPNRSNGVRKRDCFVSQLLLLIGYFARLIEPV